MSYPVSLNLSEMKVLIVGGGKVALQKAKGLKGQGAEVQVVAPAIRGELRGLVRIARGALEIRAIRQEDMAWADLIFAATDSRSVNTVVASWARKAGKLVCVADRPEEGNFSVPAVAKAGPLQLAVVTSGASPAMAKALRQKLEKDFRGSNLPWLLARLGRLRPWLKAHPKEKKKLLARLTAPALFGRLVGPSDSILKKKISPWFKAR
jgi:precorrin-2 dehydrogenase/sirohydrochlorin ferrochelatase